MCFSLEWLKELVIWLIIVGAIVACIKLLVPWLTSITTPIVGQILMIILWAIVAIVIVTIIFGLLSCLLGGGGGIGFPHTR